MHANWKLTTVADLLEQLTVTSEQQAAIASFPQRSLEWKQARYGRLTSSNFAAASGQMGQAKRTALLKDMVWPEFAGLTGFASKMAQHGVDHEDIARDVFVVDRLTNGSGHFSTDARICIKETGLLVSLTDGWLACSPDFVMQEPKNCRIAETAPANPHHVFPPYRIPLPKGYEEYLSARSAVLQGGVQTDADDASTEWVTVSGEIKCPAYGDKQLYSETGKHVEFGFPKHYIPQIQGVMNLMGWMFTDTVVFTPAAVEVTRFRKDDAYWRDILYPALHKFYFNDFLPLLELRCQGKLEPGCIVPAARPEALVLTRHARIQDPLALLQGSSEDEVPLMVHGENENATRKPAVKVSVPCALPHWLLTGSLTRKMKK